MSFSMGSVVQICVSEQHKDLVLDARLGMIDGIKMKIEDPTIPLSLKKYDQDGTETDLETGKKIKW